MVLGDTTDIRRFEGRRVHGGTQPQAERPWCPGFRATRCMQCMVLMSKWPLVPGGKKPRRLWLQPSALCCAKNPGKGVGKAATGRCRVNLDLSICVAPSSWRRMKRGRRGVSRSGRDRCGSIHAPGLVVDDSLNCRPDVRLTQANPWDEERTFPWKAQSRP